MLGASHKFLEGELEVRGNAEIALGGKDANPDYPSRFILGADYFITPKVNLFAENEWTMGRDQDTRMARAGVRSTPWTGAQINTAVNQEVLENGLRTFATLGLTQSFKISKRWNGDITFDQTKTMRNPGATPFYGPQEVPVAQGTLDNDFTAVSLGTTYFAETYTINNRVEYRTAEQEDKVGLIANWERILMRGIGYSASLQMFDTDRTDGSGLFDADVRFSLGYRPLDSRWITLNKLELKFDESTDIIGSKTRQRKLINNLVANFMPNQQNQFSLTYGIKYVVDSFDGDEYNGITQLAGGEYRYDLTPKWDIGAHVHTLYSANSSVLDYSTGVSVGWNMARNIWLSLGYNFDGFEDDDFSAAGYTATGPYVRFRMKFDQDTAKQIKHWLN